MDETGQSGSEAAGANGNGAHEHGMARARAGGWQHESTSGRGDAARAEAIRSGTGRPVLRSLDGGRAGTANSEGGPGSGWRRPVVTETRDWPENQSRPVDPVTQRSPANGQSSSFRHDMEQPVQGPWASRQTAESPMPAGRGAPTTELDPPYDGYQQPRLIQPPFDELSAPPRMTPPNQAPVPASHAAEDQGSGHQGSGHQGGPGHQGDAGAPPREGAQPAHPEAPTHSEAPTHPEAQGGRPGEQRTPPAMPVNSFRNPFAGEALRQAEALRPAELTRPAERGSGEHRSIGHPSGEHRSIGHPSGEHRSIGHPSGEHRSVEPRSDAGPRPADTRPAEDRPIESRPAEHRPEPPQQAGALRQGSPYPDRPADGYGPPMAPPRDPAHRSEPAPRLGRVEPVSPAAGFNGASPAPTLDPPRLHGPAPRDSQEQVAPSEIASRAMPLRDSFAALRAGTAAAAMEAEAKDHAAVQAAYAEAVESGRSDADQPDEPRQDALHESATMTQPFGPHPFDREPIGPQAFPPEPFVPEPPTPLGQPSLADYAGPNAPRSAARGSGPLLEPVREPEARTAAPAESLPVPRVLPQRVPAAPDVPDVPDDEPDDEFVEPYRPTTLDPPELARIATHLRYDEGFEEAPPQRPDGFDTDAVLAAVRNVAGVRDAQLKPNPGGVHTLRLDLADGADGALVSRLVARLLKQRMGLAAEPRRQSESRRNQPTAAPAQNVGQPHREAAAPQAAGVTTAPRVPIPAAEQLAGATAAPGAPQGDERTGRRHQVAAARIQPATDPEPRRVVRSVSGPRVIIDQVQVSTLGLDATVEVRLTSNGRPALGVASGPAVDGYVLRLAAVAATAALDQLLSAAEGAEPPGRCFVEHAAVVPFGSSDVAVVVVLLVLGGSAEQLSGSALVAGDPRQAIVRATLAAVNRRLDALLG